ncbi:MAG: amidohydrolase [Peptococcaceae bacterium]|jgi:amidohydrolase|nr:amidohydrolase [Peptococcaceae bacterium]
MNILEETQKIRRHLHMYPELGLDVEGTAQYIETYLGNSGLETERRAGTAVIAYIEGKDSSKPLLAIRSDMDACPMQEENDFEFRSKRPGIMHACAHDGHMAILLGLAKMLKEEQFIPEGPVKLIFQPAEETGEGAQKLISAGVLNDVDTIIGYHLWPVLEPGFVQINDGVQMAGSDRFEIVLTGKGGHGAYPSEALNPINGAVAICTEINKILDRIPIPEPVALSIGRIESGTAYNIIPERAVLEGSLRTLALDTRRLLIEEIQNITKRIAEAYKIKQEVYLEQIAPALLNKPEVVSLIEAAVEGSGEKLAAKNKPILASEDFAFYLQERPGAYFFIGAGMDRQGVFLHNPKFDFCEAAMVIGIKVLKSIINGYWKQNVL